MRQHTPDPQGPHLALVGGGAAAVALLDRLSRDDTLPHTGAVTVFEPSDRLWRGRAYQHDLDSVLVNIPPHEMSATKGRPGAFQQYLTDHRLPYGGGDWSERGHFPPRHVFGSYLESTAEAAVAALGRRGWTVHLVRTAVARARELPDAVELTDTDGTPRRFDHVVCAVGPGTPADHYRLAGEPGFVADPYPLRETTARIPRTASVTVIGTGLAAVDAVVSLARQGHTGDIAMASRNGCLPAVRQRPVHPRIQHFTPAALDRLAREHGGTFGLDALLTLLARELDAHGAGHATVLDELLTADTEPPLDRLRRQYAQRDAADTGMRVMQEAVPLSGPDAWTRLRPEDQAYIREHHYRAIMSLCCPMPPENARTLIGLAETGRLRVLAGLDGVKPMDGGGFHVVTRDGSFETSTVINAVAAPAHRVPAGAGALIGALVEGRAAEYHPAGGVTVEPDTSRLRADGRTRGRLYAIGDISGGTLFFTSGMPSVVDRADDIVGAIVQDLRTASPAAA
ncbi:FAD/NAD(P)-binding protein [Streptomyces sp. NPDC049837]|uniref:FAD/NAD(P)-binding protein n=1 Tax=Streptomyces sp. NPDC049837 TaxID=3155277 RepID=UPI003435756C